MTYTDKNGNTYRNQGGEWQVLKPGLGWSSFSCPVDIELNDGTIIPASAKEPSAPKYTEAEKSILISHARDLHMHMLASELSNPRGDAGKELIKGLAESAVDCAKALVEELKAEGFL